MNTATDSRRTARWGMVVAGVGVALAAAVLAKSVVRSSADFKATLAVVGAVAVVFFAVMRHRVPDFRLALSWSRRGRIAWTARVFYLLMAALLGMAAVAYYRFDARNLTQQRNYDDVTYYYLNSKYFEELGYTRLYMALLIADAEGAGKYSKIPAFRDLENYEMVPRRVAFERKQEVVGRFSPERWASFKRDLATIQRLWPRGNWRYLLSDHGYNPPPTWTLVGGTLARLCPVESMKIITSVDLLLVVSMFGAILWAFGIDVLIFTLLFYLTTLSGTWPLVGQALLRFDWLAASVWGVALASRNRPFGAGACLAYATLMRVFPGVLAIPFVVSAVWELARNRRLTGSNLKVASGACVCVVVLVGGALVFLGPSAFEEGARKIALHAGPESYSSQRVGLGDALVFHGERTRLEMNVRGGTLAKAEQIEDQVGFIYSVGLAVLAFLIALQLRDRREPHHVAPLFIMLVYAFTTPQVNYLNLRVLFVAWSVLTILKDRRLVLGSVTLVSMLVTEAVAQYCDVRFERYTATSASSLGLLVVFGGVLIGEARHVIGRPSGPMAALGRRFVPGALVSGMLAFAVGYALVQRAAQERERAPRTLALESVSKVRKAGSRWNEDGNVVLDSGGVAVEIGRTSRATLVELSVDGNDTYRLEVYLRGKPVFMRLLRPPRHRRSGLRLEKVRLPRHVMRDGFDTVKVVPTEGDGSYSLGHLVLSGDGGSASSKSAVGEMEREAPSERFGNAETEMTPDRVPREKPKVARRKVDAGNALLVCAYDSPSEFAANRLEGAIPLNDLVRIEPELRRDKEIIFYCARRNEASAARVAAEYTNKGFSRVTVLEGGVQAWRAVGFP